MRSYLGRKGGVSVRQCWEGFVGMVCLDVGTMWLSSVVLERRVRCAVAVVRCERLRLGYGARW